MTVAQIGWDEPIPLQAQEYCEVPHASMQLLSSGFHQHWAPRTQHSTDSWKAKNEGVATTRLWVPSRTISAAHSVSSTSAVEPF